MDVESQPIQCVSIERTVEWVDTDASGHQHNSAIVRWVEAAEAELFRRVNVTDYFPTAPRVQHLLNYRAKLWFGQRVTATVQLQAIGRTSMTFAFEIHGHPHAKSAGGLAADGTWTTVYVPGGADAAQPWPAHIRRALCGNGKSRPIGTDGGSAANPGQVSGGGPLGWCATEVIAP